MKKYFCLALLFLSTAASTLCQEQDSTKKKKNYLLLPAFRYINPRTFLIGGFYHTNNEISKSNLYINGETYYALDNQIAGHFGITKSIKLRYSILHSIEPLFKFDRFPTYKNRDLGYKLDYNKISGKLVLYFDKRHDDKSYATVSYGRIWDKFARFTTATDYTLEYLPLSVARLGYVYFQDRPSLRKQYSINVEYTNYKNALLETKDFSKVEIKLKNGWEVGPCKYFYLDLYGGYFLHNDNRNVQSYSNDLVKGSIALSYQGFNDYAYDHYFSSRRSNKGIFDNQIDPYRGGSMKYASSLSSNLGLSNNFGFSARSTLDAVNINNVWLFDLYFDLGGVSQNSKMKYLYSGGLCIKVSDFFNVYMPIVNSTDILQNYRDNKLSFFERINFSITSPSNRLSDK